MKISGKAIIIGIISGITANYIYNVTNLSTALISFFAISFLLYNLSTLEKIFDTLSMLISPVRASIYGAIITIVYFAFKGFTFTQIIPFILGGFLLLGAMAIVIENYWNI